MADETTIKKFKGTPDERLQFEMRLSGMSANFINVPYDKFDEEINNALKKLIESLGFDRSSIFELSKDGMHLRYSGARKGVVPRAGP